MQHFPHVVRSEDVSARLSPQPSARPAREIPVVHPLPCLQIALYVMCGGGTLGLRAAEQPALLRIPPGHRLPYPHRRIYRAAATLVTLAQACGLDPAALPAIPALAALSTGLQTSSVRLQLVE